MNGAARLGHILTVLLVASGCSMVAVTDVSQAVSSPGSPHRMNADGSIDLPGIGVAVVPHNKGDMRGLVGLGPIPIVPPRRGRAHLAQRVLGTESWRRRPPPATTVLR